MKKECSVRILRKAHLTLGIKVGFIQSGKRVIKNLNCPVLNLYRLEDENRFFCVIPLLLDRHWLFFQGITQEGDNDGIGIINLRHIHQIEFGDRYSQSKRKVWRQKGNRRYPLRERRAIRFLRSRIGQTCYLTRRSDQDERKAILLNVSGREIEVLDNHHRRKWPIDQIAAISFAIVTTEDGYESDSLG